MSGGGAAQGVGGGSVCLSRDPLDDDKTCPSVASWEATNGRKT